jgi:hypothetical protein
MIGIGEMKVHSGLDNPKIGTMERRLVVRIGYVEEIFEEATYLLKSPSVQTSIAVYSGMSGGVVAKYTPPDNIKPFAFISHAPDPQPVLDRSVSGHSTGSILKAKLTLIEKDKQLVEIQVNDVMVGKTDLNQVDQNEFRHDKHWRGDENYRSPGHHVDAGASAAIFVGRSAARWLRLYG